MSQLSIVSWYHLTIRRNSAQSSLRTRSALAGFCETPVAMVVVWALLGEPSSLRQLHCWRLLTRSSFETRDACEEVIKNFNNTPVSKPGGEEHLIQIRYSDTHEQKMLKQQTAAGRIFRAAEYEVGVAQARASSTGSDRYLSMSPEDQCPANEFELFLQGQT